MRKKKIKLILGLIFFIMATFAGGELIVEAAPSLADYPGINVVDAKSGEVIKGDIISGKYSSMLRITEDLSYSFKGTSNDSVSNTRPGNTVTFPKNKMTSSPNINSSVTLHDVTIYGGQFVDLRISLGYINQNGKDDGSVTLYVPTNKSNNAQKKRFLEFQNSGGGAKPGTKIFFKYEFLESGTNKPAEYRGLWNFKRLSYYKSLTVDMDTSAGMYVYNNTEIEYEQTTPKQMLAIGTVSGEKENNSFTNLLDLEKTKGVFYTDMNLIRSATAWIKYEQAPITKMELPYPQIVGYENSNPDSRDVKYMVVQDMPLQLKDDFYPRSYVSKVNLDKEIDISSARYKVVDIDGNDTTSYFQLLQRDVETNTLIFTVDSKMLSSSNFVDNAYKITIEAQLKSSFDDNKGNYYDNATGYYRIPAGVHYQTNYNTSETAKANARLKAGLSATPITQTVARGSNTDGWDKKAITDYFNNIKGAFPEDVVKIKSVENKVLNPSGNSDTVKITLVGTKTGIEKTFTVPVVVLNERKANLHYVDQNGVKISDPELRKGFETKAYDFTEEKKQIPNYKFVKMDDSGKYDPVKGTFPTADKELNIYYVYELDQHPVTIQYLDVKNENRSILDNKLEEVKVGDKHKVKVEKIPGYKLVNVTVDDKEVLVVKDEIEFEMPTKPAVVKFNYEPNHMDVSIKAAQSTATQTDPVNVTAKIDSLMSYGTNQKVNDYSSDFLITIHTKDANQHAEKPKNIKLVTDDKKDVTGDISEYPDFFTVKLKSGTKLPDTENLTLTFDTKVKADAVTDSEIKYGAEVKNTYKLNTSKANDSYESIVKAKKDSLTTVIGSLRIVEGPKEIDFGKVDYLAKNQRVEDPKIKGKLEVADTRHGSKKWTLQATLEEPLKDGTKVLPSEVKYKTDTDDITLSSAAKPIYENTQQTNHVVVSDSWGTEPGSNGIKLSVKSTDKLTKGTYVGKIRWTVLEAE